MNDLSSFAMGLLDDSQASYGTLMVWYAGFLLVSLLLSGFRFSPAVAFFSIWLGSICLITWGQTHPGYDYGEISPGAFHFLWSTAVCFVSGAAIPEILRAFVPRARPQQRTPVRFLGGSYRLAALRLLTFAACLLTLVTMAIERPSLSAYMHAGAEIRESLTAGGAGQASPLMALQTCILMIVIPAIFAFIATERRFLWWMGLPLIAMALLTLLSIGKFAIIFLGLCGTNATLYVMTSRSRSKAKKGMLVMIGLVIIAAFGLTSWMRGSLDEGGDSRIEALAHICYDYGTGYIPAFSGFYDEFVAGDVSTRPSHSDYDEFQPRFGNQTFAGIYRLLVFAGLTDRSASNHYEGVFNVYTVYRDLLTDFGEKGARWAVFAVGIFGQVLYRAKKNLDPRWLILISLFTAQMEFSLIYSLFGLIFYPLSLLASPLLGRGASAAPPTVLPVAERPAVGTAHCR